MDDPQLNKFTDVYLQKKGKKTKMEIIFNIQNKWDSTKINKVITENKKITSKADSLIYKYKLSHLKRSHRYTQELIFNATKEEEDRFELYKNEKGELLKTITELPTYNSEKYSLFLISKTWEFDKESWHEIPKIYPKSEQAKIGSLEDCLNNLMKNQR